MADAASTAPDQPPAPLSFAEAFRFWFKLGFISFGGPAGQIAIMHTELVERRRWISEKRFLHALNYCMVLPGPEAQQLATYIGWLTHRSWGGIVAGGLFILPSFFILIGLSWAYASFGQQPWLAAVFYGIKPAVTAIVLQAAFRVGSRTLKHPSLYLIAAAAFVALFIWQLPFPLIVGAAALAGLVIGQLQPGWLKPGGHGKAVAGFGPALIDDDTPTPPHARFRPGRLAAVLAGGGVLWLAPMLACLAVFGSQGAPTQIGWFFSKAALLTFGGAYAVLPYVNQGAVQHYGWLKPGQMIDGLALGETTPGPLIMVVTFVGYVAGSTTLPFGAGSGFTSGLLGALLATWFTFLPSFVFILAGGPLVEATHDELRLTAPLSAISAAVVGVIVNLALFFATSVFWVRGTVDVPAVLIAVAALFTLLRLKRSVVQVIAGCALTGLALRLLF